MIVNKIIVGVDEVGTGALCGPVVVAACAIEPGTVDGVRDSKLVDEAKRYELGDLIRRRSRLCAIAERNVESINARGLRACWEECVLEVSQTALDRLGDGVEILVDGPPGRQIMDRVKKAKLPVRFVVNGDDTVYQIAAASLVAKSYRDRTMIELGEAYPIYGFSAHKGYGTAKHLEILRKIGPCPEHRAKATAHALKKGKTVEGETAELSIADASACAKAILTHREMLNDWEIRFSEDMGRKLNLGCVLSPRQNYFLKEIEKRVGKKARKTAKA